MSDLIRREAARNAVRNLGEDYVARLKMLLLIEELPSAEPERRWIPVSEALPKNYEQTICIDSRGKMMIGMYGEYGWTFPCYMTEPVAWMPLPEPWRGE